MRYTVRAAGSLDECLRRLLAEASGRTRKQLLVTGRVRVNGATARSANGALAPGDVVEVTARVPRAVLPAGLELVYEDDDVIVVDKPAGLLTIATERERRRTVYAYLTDRACARQRPAPVLVVHRLDRLASGLLVFAASPGAKRTLQAQFAAHTVERSYVAVVEGRVGRPTGTVASRLLDDAPGPVRETSDPRRGRAAVTHWRMLRAAPRYTLLEVRLETGRRNQIRVHLARLGHPIAGDVAYGARTDPFGRLALHAHVLGFDHPVTAGRVRFVSPVPAAMAKLPP